MEQNNLERRVRVLEQRGAAHEAWGRESAKNMDDKFEKNDQAHAELKEANGELKTSIDGVRSTLTRGLTGIVLLGISILVTLVIALVRG